MTAALHTFPLAGRARDLSAAPPERRAVSKVPRYWSVVQSLDAQGAQGLLGVARSIVSRSHALVDYVDRERKEARKAGVETIAIELSAILEGGRMGDVEDALEEALSAGRTPEVTLEGFAKLRRAEHFLGEADRTISEWAESPVLAGGAGSGPACQACGSGMGRPLLGLAGIPAPLLILGVIGAGAILAVVILALVKK